MNGKKMIQGAAALRHAFQVKRRLQLEFLASLSRLLREHGVWVDDDLLAAVILAVPDELMNGSYDAPPVAGQTPRAGVGPQGIGPQGIGPQGIGPQGIGPQGIGPQSIGPQGIGPQGIGPQGIGPQTVVGPQTPTPAGGTRNRRARTARSTQKGSKPAPRSKR